jgi:pilus assembly protein CpaE
VSEQHILLSNRSRDVNEIFEVVFKEPQYKLKITGSAPETLAHIFMEMPDLIVLDGDPLERQSPEILRTIRANTSTSKIPALVILPEDKTELKQLFGTAGTCDYIIKPITPERVRNEVETLIKGRNLFGSQMHTKIITFSGVRGGCGTTTLAVNFALSLKEMDKSVILMEHANYFSGIRPALNLKSRNTVPLLMSEREEDLTSDNIMNFISEHQSGLKAVPTIGGISDMEKMDAEAVKFMKFHLCPVGDYAVFDAGYGLSEAALELFDISDRIVFVSTLDIISLYNLELIAQVFEGTRLNLDKCMVVFNHVHYQGEIAEGTIRNLKGRIPIAGFIPNNSAGFLKAINEGMPYIQLFPKTPSAKAIRSISETVFNSITTPVKIANIA